MQEKRETSFILIKRIIHQGAIKNFKHIWYTGSNHLTKETLLNLKQPT